MHTTLAGSNEKSDADITVWIDRPIGIRILQHTNTLLQPWQ